MLFDLFLIAKVHIKIEYPNKILLFIENLRFCSLKIAVCVPKITIESKNCRLKITIESKNYYLKIPVRVRMIVRTPRPPRPPRQRESRRGCRNTRPQHDHRVKTKKFFCLIYRYRKILAKKSKKNCN